MAFVKFSALVSSVVGKLNGSYFQSQKGGTALKNISPRRSKAKSTQGLLQLAQNRLSFVSRSWGQLSPSNVLLWNTYASGFERTNKNGIRYVPTGYQMFQECNSNRLKLGSAVTAEPITPSIPFEVSNCSVEMTGTGNIIFNSFLAIPADKIIVVSCSAPTFGNKQYAKSGSRVVANINSTTTLPFNMYNDYRNVWGTPVSNCAYFWTIEVIDDLSGIAEGSKLTKADAGLV